MFPYRRIPTHITCLYLFKVVNILMLVHVTIVQADVLVYSSKDNGTLVALYYDLPATFWPHAIPEDSVFKGYVVYAKPEEACEEIAKPPISPEVPENNWIVLIKRSRCDFDVKVFNAQKAGYMGAIVHNWPQKMNKLEPMASSTGKDIVIPSWFIGADDGIHIANNYTYDKGYWLVVTPDPPFRLDEYLIPFSIVVGICFVLLLATLVVKWIKDRRRQRRNRLSPGALRTLPIKKFKKGDQCDTCAICLEEYIDGEKVRILPCLHAYHTKCIDPWLTRNRCTCPMCKRKVFPGGGGDDSSNDDDSDEDEQTPLLHANQPTTYGNLAQNPSNPISALDSTEAGPSRSSSSSGLSNSQNSDGSRVASVEIPAVADASPRPSSTPFVMSVNSEASSFTNIPARVIVAVDTPVQVGIDVSAVSISDLISSSPSTSARRSSGDRELDLVV